MTRHRPDNDVNVVRHHDPRAEFVALPVEMLQCAGDQAGDFRLAQPARAVSGVQQRLDLVAIPREQLFLLVPCQRAIGGAGLFENDLTFVLQPCDFVGGQRIRESKCDKINRTFLLQMRKFAAKMQPGNQRIGWVVGFVKQPNALQAQNAAVASGILPDIEGGVPPPGKNRPTFSTTFKSSRLLVRTTVLFRRAGRTGSTAGEDARRHGREIRFGGAHFRRDIAAKALR